MGCKLSQNMRLKSCVSKRFSPLAQFLEIWLWGSRVHIILEECGEVKTRAWAGRRLKAKDLQDGHVLLPQGGKQ